MAQQERKRPQRITTGSTGPPDPTLAMKFIAEAGGQLLEASPSVSEVRDRLRELLPVLGLEHCALDAGLTTLTLSYWPPGEPRPVTVVKGVVPSRPRLESIAATLALLDRVERHELRIEEALEKLQTLGTAPDRARSYHHAAWLVSVLGWVLFLNGVNLTTVLVALLVTFLTFPIATIVTRLRLPIVTETLFAAIIIAAVPNLLAGAGLYFSVGASVVGSLFIYLPGRAFVNAVVDGLANVPVPALARAFEAMVTAGALALGFLLGGRIGTGLGVELQVSMTAAPLWLSILGAAVGVLGISIAWGMARTRIVPTVIIAALGWLIATTGRGDGKLGWSAYLLAAVFVGLAGSVVAGFQGGRASVYTGVAILPLVPGYSLYRGMLDIALGSQVTADHALRDAAIISLAIAGGVAVGLALGRNLQTLRVWLASRRASARLRRRKR